jgi:hypothetical protein
MLKVSRMRRFRTLMVLILNSFTHLGKAPLFLRRVLHLGHQRRAGRLDGCCFLLRDNSQFFFQNTASQGMEKVSFMARQHSAGPPWESA